jgi:hypothetical protein
MDIDREFALIKQRLAKLEAEVFPPEETEPPADEPQPQQEPQPRPAQPRAEQPADAEE